MNHSSAHSSITDDFQALLASGTVKRLVGDQASHSVTISEEMVRQYATLVGDENPIHIDKETGRKSIFGTNIAHGMLVGSLFGPVVVNKLLGPGVIYRSQTLNFEAPVPVGESVMATVTVKEVKEKPDKCIYILQTDCFLTASQKPVITGEAVIIQLLSPSKPEES